MLNWNDPTIFSICETNFEVEREYISSCMCMDSDVLVDEAVALVRTVGVKPLIEQGQPYVKLSHPTIGPEVTAANIYSCWSDKQLFGGSKISSQNTS